MTEREARKGLSELKKKMGHSRNWSPVLWSNHFGWYYELVSKDGYAHISDYKDEKNNKVYSSYIAIPLISRCISCSGQSDTPRKSFNEARDKIIEILDKMQKEVEILSSTVMELKENDRKRS